MSVLRPRNRLIYFRVSEEEYQRFNEVCKETGSRSISDLARSAMEKMIAGNNRDEVRVVERLALLEALVTDLHAEFHRISFSLRGTSASDITVSASVEARPGVIE